MQVKPSFWQITLITTALPSLALAGQLALHSQPNNASAVVAKVATEQRLIPIFTPKQGDWIKVANPQNGDVGWVRFTDLAGTSTPKGKPQVSFSQRIVRQSDNPATGSQVYRVIEYSGPKKLKPADVNKLVKAMRQRQQSMDKMMQQMMSNMQRDFARFQQWDPIDSSDNLFTVPQLQPTIVVPTHQSSSKQNANSWVDNIKSKLSQLK